MRPLAFIKDQNLIVTNPRLEESECRSTFGRIPAPFPPLSGQGQFWEFSNLYWVFWHAVEVPVYGYVLAKELSQNIKFIFF